MNYFVLESVAAAFRVHVARRAIREVALAQAAMEHDALSASAG